MLASCKLNPYNRKQMARRPTYGFGTKATEFAKSMVTFDRGIPEAQLAFRLETQPHFISRKAQWWDEKRHNRIGAQLALMLQRYVGPDGFSHVVFTRCSPGLADSDNLGHCFKYIRDGFAKYYGVSDADWRDGAVQWTYEQERTKYYAIRVRLVLISSGKPESLRSSPITSISRRRS